MARAVWHDTPDYYSTDTLARFWTVAHADARVASGSGYGGVLPSGSALTGVSEDAYVLSISTGLDASQEFGIGNRINITSLPASEKILLGILATGGTTAGDLHICCTLRTDGRVSLWRGNMDTLLATSTESLTTGQQLALGMTGILGHSGAVEVWVNTDPLVRVSDVDTVGADPAVWGGVFFGLAPDIFQSHLYAQVGYADLKPGYVVRVLRPIEEQLTGYTPNTDTIPECIDDEDADDDATYIYATGLDQRYTVIHDPLAEDERGVLGVRTVALVKNVSGSSPSFTPFVRSEEGLTNFGTWRTVDSSAWRAIDRWYQQNPFTDLPWTTNEINSSGWGGQTDL